MLDRQGDPLFRYHNRQPASVTGPSRTGPRLALLLATLLVMGWLSASLRGETAAQGDFPLTWRQEPGTRLDDLTGIGVPVAPSKQLNPGAPDVIRLPDGRYRMYFKINESFDPPDRETTVHKGIGSAISADGLRWTVEPGLRFGMTQRPGQAGFITSHPWVIALPDGRWRMYFQAFLPGRPGPQDNPSRIMSAISEDGLNFTEEQGIRVDVSPQTNLSFAGHGRTWQQPDDSYGMLFSGNTVQRRDRPSDVMLATSPDGLTWTVVDLNVYEKGHDPAVVRLADGRLAAVFKYLDESFQVGFSDDGLSWSQAQPLTLLDEAGNPIDVSRGYGDVALLMWPSGQLRMYSNVRASVGSFVPAE